METTGSNVKTNFPESKLLELQTYCQIVRETIVGLSMKLHQDIPQDEEGLKAARNIAKAFDSLNQAAMFANVIDSHVTYAYSFYHKGDDSLWRGNYLPATPADELGDEAISPTAEGEPAQGQGCELHYNERQNELFVHDSGEVVGDS